MLTLLVIGCVLIGLLIYSTLAVAVGQICYEHMIDGDCRDNGKHLPRQNDRDRTSGYCACRSYGGMFASVWPASMAIYLLVKVTVLLAKGPTKWGLAIANIGKSSQRAALGRMSPEELRALEKECGLADV